MAENNNDSKFNSIKLKNLLIEVHDKWKQGNPDRTYGMIEKDTNIPKSTISKILNKNDKARPDFENSLILFSYMKSLEEFDKYVRECNSHFTNNLLIYKSYGPKAEYIENTNNPGVDKINTTLKNEMSKSNKEKLEFRQVVLMFFCIWAGIEIHRNYLNNLNNNILDQLIEKYKIEVCVDKTSPAK